MWLACSLANDCAVRTGSDGTSVQLHFAPGHAEAGGHFPAGASA